MSQVGPKELGVPTLLEYPARVALAANLPTDPKGPPGPWEP